jgi:hypothetical protein
MRFVDFIRRGQVRRGRKDAVLAKSLILIVQNDMKFLATIKIDSLSARKMMTNYYDVLRSVLEAMAALEGYKVYSHEAFTFFLKEKGEEVCAGKFDRFRKIRNRINYYGKDISPREVEEHIEGMKQMIQKLREKYDL